MTTNQVYQLDSAEPVNPISDQTDSPTHEEEIHLSQLAKRASVHGDALDLYINSLPQD